MTDKKADLNQKKDVTNIPAHIAMESTLGAVCLLIPFSIYN